MEEVRSVWLLCSYAGSISETGAGCPCGDVWRRRRGRAGFFSGCSGCLCGVYCGEGRRKRSDAESGDCRAAENVSATGCREAVSYTHLTYPSVHGVVGERWCDVLTGEEVELIADSEAAGFDCEYGQGCYSNVNLIAPTLGDRLRAESCLLYTSHSDIRLPVARCTARQHSFLLRQYSPAGEARPRRRYTRGRHTRGPFRAENPDDNLYHCQCEPHAEGDRYFDVPCGRRARRRCV